MSFIRDFTTVLFVFLGSMMVLGIVAFYGFMSVFKPSEVGVLATPGDIAMTAVAVIGSTVVFVVCWVGFKILQLRSRNYTRRLIEQDADHQKNDHPESTEQEQQCIEENHPLNKSSSRIFQYFGIFLLSLFISYLVLTFVDREQNVEQAKDIKKVPDTEQTTDNEQPTDVDIVGVWQSEPILGQLGLIQSSYKFNVDGSYSNKLDMISFCEEQYGQDCEYFWIIYDGTYSIKNGVVNLSVKEDKGVILRKGQSKPDSRIDTDYNPRSNEYKVNIDAGNLVLTNIKNNESVIYSPFVATEQDETVPSVDARDVEQATDIVGAWQSEPVLGPVGLTQSSYTFNKDGSYSNKVDILRLCKDVPEQNCEYYWTVLDGKYVVKNGVITLYIKEVRTEILRKGKNKPDILIAPDRPHSGDEYMAKLDTGKLFMISKKSNELVVFKSLNND